MTRRPSTSSLIFAVLALSAAGAVSWSRLSISRAKRTRQDLKFIKTAPGGGLTWYSIIQRSNASDPIPEGIFLEHTEPHAPGGYKNRSGSPPLHSHVFDDEEFEPQMGRAGYINNGVEGEMEVGRTYFMKRGDVHTFWNAEPDKPMELKIKLINRSGKYSPMERFFEQWGGLMYDHGGNPADVNPLQLMLLFKDAGIEVAAPWPVQFLIRHVACNLARLIGYKGFHPDYAIPY